MVAAKKVADALLVVAGILAALCAPAAGGEGQWVELESFDEKAKRYEHGLGGEFPGARATFRWHEAGATDAGGALAIDYDFAKGGAYVGWFHRKFIPSTGRTLRFMARSDEPVTVLKAITLAGGTTDRAAEKKVQVMRKDPDGNTVSLLVNLRKIKKGKAEDPILQADDIVLVPESFF